ncbi:RNA polymerase sigma factor [Flavobacterium galactosidilyticum]|uniref:RNA polymerase sigma factor n=1 Tax=Flavobacterium galactosidilyticum TaxID=2893886 RepID=UPI001E5E1FDE|nr:RNA polymerase sigma factor [Flavobacterium sp. F-340]UFH46991.1 RNA polymerase sigma factor [Flavobacterium sp. F-340]
METFEEILNKHKGIIFRIVNYYCKDSDDKKDLEQEILIQIWLSHKKYNQEFAWSTFIYRIALNVSIGFYNKQKRQKDKFSNVNLFIETNVQDDIPLVVDEDLQLLNEFICQLNDINKALMILYLQEKSYAEMALILGVSATNIGTKINRLKNQLKEYFKEKKNGNR